MGFFGGKHRDIHDCVTSLSCALSLVDIPRLPGWEPGRLHLVGPGVYFPLSYLARVFFSGLLVHGGDAPLCPDGAPIPKWALRALLISYPPTGFSHGLVKYPMVALPNCPEPLYFTPELSGAPHKELDPYPNRSTFAADGSMVMEDKSSIAFQTRGAYQSLRSSLSQLPRRLELNTDVNQFMALITWNNNGKREPAPAWPEGPSGDVVGITAEHKEAQQAVLHDLYDRRARAIPGIPSKNPYPADGSGASIILARRCGLCLAKVSLLSY